MGEAFALLETLMTGGKIAGLTLPQILAIVSVLRQEEPNVERLVKDAAPLVQKFMAAMNKPVTNIPGYGHDGSVVGIPNPNHP